MKIAIPVDQQTMETTVCPSFGRAPFFLFYNTETKEGEFVDNSAVASQGGAGIKAAQMIADYKADVLITPRCGENAEKVLSEANILIYKINSEKVLSNIEDFSKERLILLKEIHPGFHGKHGA